MSFPGGSLGQQARTFKQRLKWILQNTEGGHQEKIAAHIRKMGLDVSRATISRWMNPESDATPDPVYLMAILKGWPKISSDWMLGRKKAETVDEQFIESKL